MILYFNPGHETAVKNASPYYTAPANVVAMQKELSFLPAWYGERGDVVLVDSENFDSEYYKQIRSLFSYLPSPLCEEELHDCRTAEISLWGISPQAIYYFNELCHKYDCNLKTPKWDDRYTALNSRITARECLISLKAEVAAIADDIVPSFYTDMEQIEEAVNQSTCRLLSKAPYSSSGRGLLWLPESGLTRTERQILHGILKKQGCVSVEKALNKDIDFAMEFVSDGAGTVSFAGYSLFYTNIKGGYDSNYIGAQESIVRLLTNKISPELLSEIKEKLRDVLQTKFANIYKGCIGVDMMVYKDEDVYKIHPCVEINMRYNMGYLSLRLSEKYISQTSEGRFAIRFSAKNDEIYSQHSEMQQQHPLSFDQEGKIEKGYLPLCAIGKTSTYWAYILVEKSK